MTDLWDVYVWSIDDAGQVYLAAKSVDYDKAQEVYDRYFSTNIWDAYMVPAGTRLFMY